MASNVGIHQKLGRAKEGFLLEPPEGALPWWHLDFRPLGSRMVREWIQFSCFKPHRKLIYPSLNLFCLLKVIIAQFDDYPLHLSQKASERSLTAVPRDQRCLFIHRARKAQVQKEPHVVTLRSAPTRNRKADTQPCLSTCQDQLPTELQFWVGMDTKARPGHRWQTRLSWSTLPCVVWWALSLTISPTDTSIPRPSCHGH